MFNLVKKISNWILLGLSPRTKPVPEGYNPEDYNHNMDSEFVYPDGSQLASFHKDFLQKEKDDA